MAPQPGTPICVSHVHTVCIDTIIGYEVQHMRSVQIVKELASSLTALACGFQNYQFYEPTEFMPLARVCTYDAYSTCIHMQ